MLAHSPSAEDNGAVAKVTSREEQGWAELRSGRWPEARAQFEAALADGQTPEALEGLSWAAWWLDDAALVFDARERAYRGYRDRGDDSAAALMCTWLAADELDFNGATAVANGWLRRAHRLLDGVETGPSHGWLAFHDGYLANAQGDGAEARRQAVVAAELGRRFAVPDLEMLGLALEGSVLVADAQVDEGMRRLDEATVVALEGEATVPISGAWACCFMVGACMAVLDLERAGQWCDRIAEFAERYGSRYMLAFCRAEYGALHLTRGDWPAAEKLLEAAIDDFSRSRPAWVGSPLVGLAELRRRQGKAAEAATLLDRAGSSGSAQLCRARLLLDGGEAQRAAELLEGLLRRLPEGRSLDRAPALETLVLARIAHGELDEAEAALAELRGLEALIGTAPLRASRELAEGMLAAARGGHEAARELLEDAVAGFERGGAPYEAAHARIELAASLAALGRADADPEAAAAAEALAELGAPRLRSSQAITARERDVLALVAEGLTNRQIAERLVVSEHTVHRHVTNILRKLDVPSRTAAATYAVRTGLVENRRA